MGDVRRISELHVVADEFFLTKNPPLAHASNIVTLHIVMIVNSLTESKSKSFHTFNISEFGTARLSNNLD